MIDKKKIAKSFGKHAATYDKYASVQKKMADRLLEQVRKRQNFHPGRILEIGCGTGYLTRRLALHFPQAIIDAVDIASGMIAQASKTLSHPFLQFHCADIETMQLNKRYDLIISNATFQWLEFPNITFNRLISSLSNNGIMAFTTFCEKTFYELRKVYQEMANEQGLKDWNYPGLNFHNALLIRSWLNRSAQNSSGQFQLKEWLEVEKFSGAREFLESVHKIGAAVKSNSGGIFPALSLREVIRRYENLFSKDGLVNATYHCFLYVSGQGGKE